MADIGRFDTSVLRPQGPQPMSLHDLINTANEATNLGSDLAINEALQHSRDPSDPSGINYQKFQSLILQDPRVTRRRLETLRGLQGLRTETFGAEGVGTSLDLTRTNAVQNFLGSMADRKFQDKAALTDYAMRWVRNNPMLAPYVSEFLDKAPNDAAGLQRYLATMQLNVMGAPAVAGPEAGTPTPGGAPVMQSKGAGVMRRLEGSQGGGAAAPGVPAGGAPVGGQVTGTSAGFPKIAGASAEASIDLRKAFDTSMVRKGMLGNLEEDLHKFTSGPAADWTRVGKAWINRNVPLPKGWQFDPASIASQENFVKQATMLAQQQFQAIGGTGTDEKFNSAFMTNPNETLSQMGNRGIIAMLKGNEDALQTKYRAWRKWAKEYGPESYDEFSERFNEHFDPRVFQFKYLSKEDRQAYVMRMDPRDRTKFLTDLWMSNRRGWTKPEDTSVR